VNFDPQQDSIELDHFTNAQIIEEGNPLSPPTSMARGD
jgi:hypothetical protein